MSSDAAILRWNQAEKVFVKFLDPKEELMKQVPDAGSAVSNILIWNMYAA